MRANSYLMLILLLIAPLLTCAPEQSTEVRRREESVREYDRLTKAAGTYLGYMTASDTEIAPLSIEITATKNPTNQGEKPTLAIAMRIGLFGGVTVVSTSSNYDWGTSELSASFAKTAQPSNNGMNGSPNTGKSPESDPKDSFTDVGNTLELRGKIDDGKFISAYLLGSHIGKRPIKINKGGTDLFDANPERRLDLHWETEGKFADAYGVFTIKRTSLVVEAPATSDLPILPGFDAAVNFEPFATTPQTAKRLLYDPLAGTLDVQFTDSAWMRTSGVFLSSSSGQEPNSFVASITMGGHLVRRVQMIELPNTPVVPVLPPATYLGTYQGTPTSVAYRAIAYLDYQGSVGSNQPDLPFPNFPRLRFEVDICNGDEVYKKTVLTMELLDYLNRTALFRRQGTDQDPLQVIFNKDWSYLDSTFLGSSEGSGQDRPKVKLRPNAEVLKKGCAANSAATKRVKLDGITR